MLDTIARRPLPKTQILIRGRYMHALGNWRRHPSEIDKGEGSEI